LDVILIAQLDRLARSVHHLLSVAKEFEALGVGLVVTEQALDTTTPSGRLLFYVLAAVAEFERDIIRERVISGLRRAKAQGRHLGRPRLHNVDVTEARKLMAAGLSLRAPVGRSEFTRWSYGARSPGEGINLLSPACLCGVMFER
jgi:DNA invertase Pin-like site-specific DNA recombinase